MTARFSTGWLRAGSSSLRRSKASLAHFERPDARVETLTTAQDSALQLIEQASASRAFSPSSFTASRAAARTEVYLRAARRVLDDGGGRIVLVPEIGLLPQATARLPARVR
jgi:primosomal protein N' (replication factor Y)